MRRPKTLPMVLVMVGLTALPHLALADSRAEAEKLAHAGELLFDAGKYRDALQQFLDAYSRFDPPRFVIPEVIWNIGRCHEEMGDDESALKYFVEFARYAQDEAYREAARKKVAEVRLRLQAIVTVEVEPEGVEVAVDGQVVGESPLREPLRLEAGRHVLRFSREGFRGREEAIEVRPKEARTVKVVLEPRVGSVRVVARGGPATGGVRVLVDGAEVHRGSLPARIRVPAGRRSLLVLGPEGVEPVIRYLEVPDGGEVEVAMDFPLPRPETAPGSAVRTEAPREGVSDAVKPPSRFPWHFVVAGSGAAMVAGGGALTALAARDRSKVTGADTASDGTVTGVTRASASSYASSARTKDTVSYILYWVGGAALVGGVLWWVLGDDGEASTAARETQVPSIAASPVPGGVAVATGWRF